MIRITRVLYLVIVALGAVSIGLLAVWVETESRIRTQQIQESRLDACRDQNFRHDRTIRELQRVTALARARADSPEERLRIATGYRTSVLLINTLAPRVDCLARVTPPSP